MTKWSTLGHLLLNHLPRSLHLPWCCIHSALANSLLVGLFFITYVLGSKGTFPCRWGAAIMGTTFFFFFTFSTHHFSGNVNIRLSGMKWMERQKWMQNRRNAALFAGACDLNEFFLNYRRFQPRRIVWHHRSARSDKTLFDSGAPNARTAERSHLLWNITAKDNSVHLRFHHFT